MLNRIFSIVALSLSLGGCIQNSMPEEVTAGSNELPPMNEDRRPSSEPTPMTTADPQTMESVTVQNDDVPPAISLADCQAQRAWERASVAQFSHIVADVAEGNHVVLAQGSGLQSPEDPFSGTSVALSLETGETVFNVASPWGWMSTDARWQVTAFIEEEHGQSFLVMQPLLEAPALWRSALDPAFHHQFVQVSPDSRRVLTWGCDRDSSLLTSHSGIDGRLEVRMELPVGCALGLPEIHGNFVTSRNGLIVAIGSNHQNSFTVVDLVARSHTVIDATPDPEAMAEAHPRTPSLVSLAVSPDGASVVAVVGTGKIRLWDLNTMEERAPMGDAKLFAIDQRSYMPSMESPIAFSKGGALFAYFNSESDVVVVSTQTGEPVAVLEGSQFSFNRDEEHPFDAFGNVGNEAIRLEFLGDNSGLLANYKGGITLWRCADAMEQEGRDDLAVHLAGPRQARVAEAIEITATHLGNISMHGHAFFLNGQALAVASTGRHLSWTPETPGEHLVEVEIRDGLNTGRSSLRITVTE
jgi:hypothetical protein